MSTKFSRRVESRRLPPSKRVDKFTRLGLAIRQLKSLWRIDESFIAQQFGMRTNTEVYNWTSGKHPISLPGASKLVSLAELNGLSYSDLDRMAAEEESKLRSEGQLV